MANTKLSDKTTEATSINDTDRSHIIVLSGTWASKYIKWSTVKSWILTFLHTNLNQQYAFSNKSSAFSQAFDAMTVLDRVIFIENSGTPSVKIGSTNGGEEFMAEEVVSNVLMANINQPRPNSYTLYIGVSGGNVDVVIEYHNIY